MIITTYLKLIGPIGHQSHLGKGNVVADALSKKLVTLACMFRDWAFLEQFRDMDVEY